MGLSGEDAVARTLYSELGIDSVKIEAFKPKDLKKIVSEDELPRYLAEGVGYPDGIAQAGKNSSKSSG